MQNRKIRHLFTQSYVGRFYVHTDLQTQLNIDLLNANIDGVRAFARLGDRLASKYNKQALDRLKLLSK